MTRPTFRRKSRTPVLAVLGAALLAASSPALAQGVGQGPGYGAPGFPPANAAVQAELRMTQLEEQIRQLTGRVEELTYDLRQLRQRVERMQSDNDFRFEELSGRGGAPAPPAAEREVRPPGPPVAAAPPSGDGAASRPRGVPTELGPRPQLGAAAPPPPGQSRVIQPAGPSGAGREPPMREPPPREPPPREPAQTRPDPGQTQTARATPDQSLPAGAPQQQYDQAFSLLTRADYEGAERALKGFLAQHPGDPLAGNAQYWLGETYYVRRDYTNAAVAFAEGYQKYPKSNKAPDNLLKLGMSLAQLNRRDDACRTFQRLEQSGDAPASLKDRGRRERQRLGC